MLLNEGLSNCREGLLYPEETTTNKRIEKYIAEAEEIINKTILGTDDDPCHYRIPYDKETKALAPITMDNNRAREIVSNFSLLLDITVVNEPRKALWNIAIESYRRAMKLLRQKEDFTNERIEEVQKLMDLFFQNWVKLHGLEGVTNYIHMMGAGHLAEYLYKWRNLYRYSQQGWEAMNALIKTFFFRRTNHGGAAGNKGTSKKSRLVPIARWLQRRMMFLCGYTENDIDAFMTANPITNPRTQRIIDATDSDLEEEGDEEMQVIL